MKRDSQPEASTEVKSLGLEKQQQFFQTLKAETDDKTYVNLSENELDHSKNEKLIQKKTKRYHQCTGNYPARFKINGMARAYMADEPSVRAPLQGDKSKLWQEALSKKSRL